MDPTDVPVLVAGGGPTGLTAALLLARAGVPVLLAERRPSTSVHPRARGLNVRTMEIFRALGLEEPIRAAGAALAASRYMLFVDTLAGEEIRRVPDDELAPAGEALAAISPCDWCQCAQDALEPLLVEAARRHGAELRFGTELSAIAQDADGVTATLLERASGGRREVRADYLIAADGAASPIRRALGVQAPDLGVPERGPLGHYINIYCRADLRALVRGREFGICFVEHPGAQGLFLAVNNADRWLFNVEYAPERGETAADFPPDRCAALVRAAVGLPDLEVEVLSVLPWEAASRLAERFQVGRVFLAGDAAHMMPPAGGFGLNTGVQDAHNLAWKLAATLAGAAGPGLLPTYDIERRAAARLAAGRAVDELTAPTPDAIHGPDGDAGPAWGEAADLLGQLVPVLGYRYTSAAVVPDRGDDAPTRGELDLVGRPGARAPHVWLERAGRRRSPPAPCDGALMLLTGADGEGWCGAARTAAARAGVALPAYRVGPDGDLVDRDGRWPATYGVTDAGAVLIRPDGFVGWRCVGGAPDPGLALSHALAALLCRDPPRNR